MEFRLLGSVEVRDDAGNVLAIGGAKPRTLLVLLLLNANQVVSTERLIDELWEDRPPVSARQTVHHFVHRLRQVLEPAGGREPDSQLLVTQGTGYLFRVADGELDVERAERLARQARHARAQGRLAEATEAFTQALALWRGPALAGLNGPTVQASAARLEELRSAMLLDQIDVELDLGHHSTMLAELEALVREHPLWEGLQSRLILALYRAGRVAEALAAFRTARWRLVNELGIEPGRELQRLERAILARDDSLDAVRPQAQPAADVAAAAPPDDETDSVRPRPEVGATRREERKLVTVLVASLDQTALDPEDIRAHDDVAAAPFRREVERFGGACLTFVGGAAVAVFGASRAHEDDPERAVRAALAFVAALRAGTTTVTSPASEAESRDAAAAQWMVTGDTRPVRVGVETGEVLVVAADEPGEAAAQTRLEVIGEVIARAHALAAAAPPDSVAVGATTARTTRWSIDYEVVDASRGPWLARAPRSLVVSQPSLSESSPLIEREHELTMLGRLMDHHRQIGEPQLVTVIGTPGIGKTRLVAELAELADTHPDLVAWRQGRSPAYGEQVTFWALAEIVKAQAGILDTDAAEVAASRLRHAVSVAVDDSAEAAWITRHLHALVGLDTTKVEPGAGPTEAFTAWRRFLTAIAAQRPMVLVFEDAQWADDALLDFIDELVDDGQASLLVVCTGRSELLARRPGWGGGKRNATTISLAPLTAEGTSRLLAALLEGVTLPGPVERALVAAAGGNPLFVEQYVRMLRDRGMLQAAHSGSDDLAATPQIPANLPVPESVGQLISARLDTLPLDDKALLQDAAVTGEVCWVGALAAITGRGHGDVEAWLARLERRELVRRAITSSLAGQTEFTFQHVLVRDVAYGQLPRARRAERHQGVAEWLETLGADRAELLAHHYQQALALTGKANADPALIRRARPVLREAGDRAMTLSSYGTAARFYQAALELWPADEPDQPELILRLGEAHCRGEGSGEALLAEAVEALLAVGEPVKAAEAEVLLARLAWQQARGADRIAHMERAWQLIKDAPPSPSKVRVLSGVTSHLAMWDRYAEAIAVGEEAISMARSFGMRVFEEITHGPVGVARTKSGDLRGIEELAQSAAMLDELRSKHVVDHLINFASMQSYVGDLEASAAAYARARRAAEQYRVGPFDRLWLDAELAMEHFRAGRWQEATPILDRFLAASAGDHHYLEANCRVTRGKMALAAGDVDTALTESGIAIDLARPVGDLSMMHPALAFRARALTAAGRLADAAPLADELLGILPGRLVHMSIGVDLPLVLVALGRTVQALDDAHPVPSRWLEAARAFVAGDLATAAEHYAAIGSLPDEADARLRAADTLLTKGCMDAAAAHLRAAVALLHQMGLQAAAYAAERRLVALCEAPQATVDAD